jgi:hypothetical protein
MQSSAHLEALPQATTCPVTTNHVDIFHVKHSDRSHVLLGVNAKGPSWFTIMMGRRQKPRNRKKSPTRLIGLECFSAERHAADLPVRSQEEKGSRRKASIALVMSGAKQFWNSG